MKPVRILEEAAQDLERGRDFYARLAPGLGEYFVESILKDLTRLSKIHGVHGRYWGFNRMLARRFPYAVYYLETPSEVRIVAILDLRKDPQTTQKTLSDINSP